MTTTAVPVFEKLSNRRSFEAVAAQIRAQIHSGALRLGDRLPAERELAVRLGVSRNTVREALRALENAGLLTLKKGVAGGAFVASRGGDVVMTALSDLYRLGFIRTADLTEARLIIGREVARLACERRDEADMEALEQNVAHMQALALSEDLIARADTNLEFHKLLAAATKNPVLVILTNALVEVTRDLVHVFGPMPNKFAIASRQRMLKLIRERDGSNAAQEMARYLEKAQRRYFQKVEKSAGQAAPTAGRRRQN
jgi:GntR family transcriptional regulator, transcriptional repressor for pyruvate dehydrogenase complex